MRLTDVALVALVIVLSVVFVFFTVTDAAQVPSAAGSLLRGT